MSSREAPAVAAPLISYAQNHEDVQLWRVFRHLETGYYVDIGANSPSHHSVTKLFYDRGWRGINIEPITSWFEELRAERARDVNLKLCISDTDGQVEMVEVVGTGLSTLDSAAAETYRKDWETRTVVRPARTLASVLAEHRLPEIHFLKIDVEGAEREVLAGADFDAHRPWIVVVESVKPGTQEPSHLAWEQLLLDAGYEHLWFDGLNRFYGARDRLDALTPHFEAPLNVHDSFLPIGAHEANQLSAARGDKLHELSQLHHRVQGELDAVHVRLREELRRGAELGARVAQLEHTLARLRSSLSWRLTTPLRLAEGPARRVRERLRRR